MRIYLDICCFNRPYDDQSQPRIHLETQAKLLLQQKVRDAEVDLVWSSTLDFECHNNPFQERKHAILQWRTLAATHVMANAAVIAHAKTLQLIGVGAYDALHIASAAAAQAHMFVTTDDKLIKKMRTRNDIPTLLPGDAIALLENWYEN